MTEYQIIRSRRKTIAIQITPQGEVLVRAPFFASGRRIRAFVESREGWIQAHLEKQTPPMPPFTAEELQLLAQKAKAEIPERTAFFAEKVGVTYGRVTIRAQRTRWGSCSGRGNLNFNCLLMLTPDDVRDYVIVHELCHRLELNHSPRFWAQVERVLPDYRARRKWLKENGSALICRIPAV